MKRYKPLIWLLLVMIFGVTSVFAQDTCPDIVQEAIATMGDVCAETARNQACYGNGEVIVVPQSGASVETFSAPGDLAVISDIETLTLSGLDENLGYWGVVLLQVQANIPDTLPGQNVTVLLFGDTEVSTAGDSMDAFYFSSGVGEADCAQAPNGILIQTPEGVGTIDLTINGMEIALGSTAYITAEPEGLLTFALLEGSTTLTAGEEEIALVGGEFSSIELDEDLNVSGVFADPLPIEGNLELPELPLSILPKDISEDSGSSSGSVGLIVPRSGTWLYTIKSIETDGCPAAVEQSLSTTIASTQLVFPDFGDEELFNFETFWRENSQDDGMGWQFSSPEINVYLASSDMEGATFSFEMRFINETTIEGTYLFGLTDLGCNATIEYDVTLQE